MSPKLKFAEGEKVLCFHGPLIYEAKALKSTITKDKQIKYYIHYAGWNKNWDEWVPENRVLKYNEANVQRQKEVFKQHSSLAAKNKKGSSKSKRNDSLNVSNKDGATASGGGESRASTPSKELNPSTTSTGSGSRSNRSKHSISTLSETNSKKDDSKEDSKDDKDEPNNKRKRGGSNSTSLDKSFASSTSTSSSATANTTGNIASVNSSSSTAFSNRLDATVECEETFLSKIEVKIKIPDELKQCLADDWDAITRQHKLLDLPAKITVQDIVDQYIAFKKSAKTNISKDLPVTDVLNGIIEYFNVMLGSQLLYKFERPQYAEILQQNPDTPLTKLYGAFHLLRLFVKLGTMLSYSALDEKSMQTLLNHLHDFLKFLVKNNTTYFNMTNFVNVSPEYHRHTQ